MTRSTPGVGASPEDEARVELQRSLRAWLDLQSSVNALIDSTTAPEKGTTVCPIPCVRIQGLEDLQCSVKVLTASQC